MCGRVQSLLRCPAHHRLDELDELEERERGVGGSRGDIARSNPFQRNFRKSMFRDGPAWSQWMERIHEYGIQVSRGWALIGSFAVLVNVMQQLEIQQLEIPGGKNGTQRGIEPRTF